MVGRPKLQRLIVDIEDRALNEGYATGEEYILTRIAEGESWSSIGETFGISRYLMQDWCRQAVGRGDRVAAARKLSADAHAERAGSLLARLEGKAVTSQDVALAVSRSNYEKWLASIRDKEQYGEQTKGAAVTISIGTLHLDALRAASAAMALTATPIAILANPTQSDVIDAELIEE